MLRKIPFHIPYIGSEEIDALIKAIKSTWITMGPKTFEFEKSIKGYLGSRNVVAVSSCTAAMHLSLRVLRVGHGDEVIIPAINFASAGEVCCQEGARPVLADIEKKTGNILVGAIEKAISKKTKAIIAVHYGGQPCDMDEILELAHGNHISIIEDAAHALPSIYKGEKAGTIGDIGCFSFYATKTLTTGEGGIAVTENDEWAERMRVLRLHGITKDAWKRYADEGDWYYEIVDLGYKYNMTDIQAALGLVQLKKLEWMWEQRCRIANRYIEAFAGVDEIELLTIKNDRITSWHLFPIFLRLENLKIDRKRFIELLKERGISASVHFIPLYRHPFYRNNFNYEARDFPNSEWFYEREVSLPIYPSLSEKEQDYVIENILDICKKSKR